MTPLLQFWNEQYGVSRPLEVDSWGRRALNRYLVAAFMNRFPKAATKLFAQSSGELARRLFVEREGGSYRVLRAMYDYEDPRRRGDLLNRLLMASPAIKAARNRRTIAQQMLHASLAAQAQDAPLLVLAVGGGDGRLEAEVLARAARQDVYYCCIDKDPRAFEENHAVLKEHGLAGRGFVFLGDACETRDLQGVVEEAHRRFGIAFSGVSVAVCHGITEYLDLGSPSNETFAGLLRAIFAYCRPEGRLIVSQTDYHDRVPFLERGLAWYMRLRTIDELTGVVEKIGWQISVCEHEPMELISMCLAVKSDGQHRRLDGPSRGLQPGQRPRVPAGARRRLWQFPRR